MKRDVKLNIVKDLLAQNGNKFTAEQLLTAAGTARRARSALFLSRKNGISLEAIRDNGRKVVSYMLVVGNTEVVEATKKSMTHVDMRTLITKVAAELEQEETQKAAEKATA